MSNFFRRELALEIEQCFRAIFTDVGFIPMTPVPVIDHSDQSVLFTGATINAVKFDACFGQLSVPGSLLGQDCVRLQNLKFLGDPAFAPQYMSCFRMFSVCAHPSGQNALAEGSTRFLHALKQRWGAAISVSCHSEQAELMRTFNILQVADSVHLRPEPMTWIYGIGDLLTGAGMDIMVGGGGRSPRSAGQLVQLHSEGTPAGYEFGFGVETLGAAVSGGLSPFDAGELAEITTDNNEPLRLQLADTIVALQRLHDAGLRPGHDPRGSTMRKMLRLLPAVAERVGFNSSQVDALFGRLGSSQLVEPSASLASLVAESWKKRDTASKFARAYIDNQMRLCGSGTQSPADAAAKSEAYLKRLGKLLPVEVDELVRNIYPTADKQCRRQRNGIYRPVKLNNKVFGQMNEQDTTALEQTYDAGAIEPKWQAKWRADDTYSTAYNEGGSKCYVLDMFPYPSGTSMHVGHPRGYVATDAYSRFKRMQGFQVLHPMGWDSFGLPAEETAIARQEYPSVTVDRNIEQFKGQLQRLGMSYDWTREIKTTDPGFYRHTQRLFLEFFRRGLAYNSITKVNWCAALGTVLANEDIVNGRSERGDHPVELLPMRQWMLRITAYATRLVHDLDTLPLWPESVKNAQRAWIGRSEGHELAFPLLGSESRVKVYTTRLETIGGVTFVAIAPESDLGRSLAGSASNSELALAFIEKVRARTERDRRTSTTKTGIVLENVSALNPVNGETVPVVLADYVIEGYGTGAVMGVPAHDERDAEFAGMLGLPTRIVFDEHDRLINSGDLDGMSVAEARDEITCQLALHATVQFKMRDWVFSRQRFWGEPIPIVWVAGEAAYEVFKKGLVAGWLPETPVSYEDGETRHFAVPIIPDWLAAAQLPIVDKYQPTGRAEGPLAGLHSWVNVWIDPTTGEVSEQERGEPWIKGSRETNTMPQWAGSSWYWLRFMDPRNDREPFSMEAAHKWGPVDVYAGADHAVAHLLYARFWQKVLFDAGLVDHNEPFKRLEFLGYVLASDGTKISKRSGNSRNPDEVIADVGADAFRLYEMAIGPFEKAVPWSDDGLTGQHRFLKRVHAACQRVMAGNVAQSDPGVAFLLHTAIGRVGEDIEAFKFNTAVSALMIFLKESEGMRISVADFRTFVQLLAPFAPHIAEELWERMGGTGSVHRSDWPAVDTAATVLSELRVPVQINGKRRTEVTIRSGAVESEVREVVFGDLYVQRLIDGRQITKFVFVADKIVNLVVT